MYSIVGFVMNSEIVCACEECSGLTEEEVTFLKHGADHHSYLRSACGVMDRWPRRDKWGSYERDEVTGEIIFDEDVTITDRNLPVDDQGERVGAFSDGEESLDGEYCGACSAEIIEPYTIQCYECDEIAFTGEKALDIEKGYNRDQIFCKDCFEKIRSEAEQAVKLAWVSASINWKVKDELRQVWSDLGFFEVRDHIQSRLKDALRIGWREKNTVDVRSYENAWVSLDTVLSGFSDRLDFFQDWVVCIDTYETYEEYTGYKQVAEGINA